MSSVITTRGLATRRGSAPPPRRASKPAGKGAKGRGKPSAKKSPATPAVPAESSEEQEPEPQQADQGNKMDMDMNMIDLVNAAKASVDESEVAAALNADDTDKALRKLIVTANEKQRASLQSKKTATAQVGLLRQQALQLGADTDRVAKASKIKTKKKAVAELQNIIIVQQELHRTDIKKLAGKRDDNEEGMQIDVSSEQSAEEEAQEGNAEEETHEDSQHDPLSRMDTDDLMEKAVDMGISEAVVNMAMNLDDDARRRARLIDVIMNPPEDPASGGSLSTAQRAALGKLKPVQMAKLRKHLKIDDRPWKMAVAHQRHKDEMLKLIIETLIAGHLDQEQINAALAAVDIVVDGGEAGTGGGRKVTFGSEEADDDVATAVAGALVSAAQKEQMMAAGATGDKEGHTASAKMIKTVLESGGGLPAPSSNGGHKATFDQQLFRKALDNSNRAVWTQMLADNPEMMRRVLQQAQGSSVTIDELTEAGRSQTQQGRSAIVPWIEKEAVGEPLGEWEGVLPRVKSADLPKKFRNVHLPMQFHERDYSVGALYDTLADDSEANRFLSEGAKALKSEEAFQKARKNHVFKTTSDFRDAIDRLADYSANTQPALMPSMSEELAQHTTYARNLITEMKNAGANDDPVVMKIYVLYDEEIRLRRAKATVQTAWTDDFTTVRARFLTKPLSVHEQEQKKKTRAELKRLTEKCEETERTLTAVKRQKAGQQGKESVSYDVWDKLKNLDGANKEHLAKDGKNICIEFCKKSGGCKRRSCKFSHHCLKCGGDHSILSKKCGK
jgi:hypothetical protein